MASRDGDLRADRAVPLDRALLVDITFVTRLVFASVFVGGIGDSLLVGSVLLPRRHPSKQPGPPDTGGYQASWILGPGGSTGSSPPTVAMTSRYSRVAMPPTTEAKAASAASRPVAMRTMAWRGARSVAS